jgi:hypothetical protein
MKNMAVYESLTEVLVLLVILAGMLIFASLLTTVIYSVFTFIFSIGGSKSLLKLMQKYRTSIKAIFYGVFLFIGALFVFSYFKFTFADSLLTQIIIFIPRAFVAILVLYAGYVSYSLVNAFIKSASEDIVGPGLIPILAGQSIGIIILAVFATISLDIIGLDAEIIKIFLITCLLVIAIPLTVLLGTLAWFFGSNLGAGYYLRFAGLREGKKISFKGSKGTVESVSPTHVKIQTSKGKHIVLSAELMKEGWEEQ